MKFNSSFSTGSAQSIDLDIAMGYRAKGKGCVFLRWYLVPGELLICNSPVVASCPIKINILDFLVIVKQDVWGAQIAV